MLDSENQARVEGLAGKISRLKGVNFVILYYKYLKTALIEALLMLFFLNNLAPYLGFTTEPCLI